jgi:hypothetical protein
VDFQGNTMTTLERYRHAVAKKSQAEEYCRTAVQHCDIYMARDQVEYWTKEVVDSLTALRLTFPKLVLS